MRKIRNLGRIGFDSRRLNDGVNLRFTDLDGIPSNYQLAVIFTDETALVFTVAMYGGIIVHFGDYDNEYYIKSREYTSPFSDDFADYFYSTLNNTKGSLSAKAFLATEQRFPGIGNGTVQDILFESGIHPKRKISTFDDSDRQKLLKSTVSVLAEMTAKNGRDTEKDLFGKPGGYLTKMSKNSVAFGCPVCGGAITKEAYLGGTVYYCPVCQKIK